MIENDPAQKITDRRVNAPGEDATISRDSLPLASRGFRMVERI